MSISFTRIAPMVLVALALAGLVSCKVDHSKASREAMELMSPTERLYYSENRNHIQDDAGVATIAREAARLGYVNVLRLLHATGKNLNDAGPDGMNTALAASDSGQLEVLRFLVEQTGADVRSKNGQRSTCLMLAVRGAHSEVALYLLDRGANINARSDAGTTALMYAAASGRDSLVKLLVERGANLHAKNNEGRNAADFAATDSIREFFAAQGLRALGDTSETP